jgi:hypothetical protein
MSDPQPSPLHTRGGATFGAPQQDSGSPDSSRSSPSGRGRGGGRLRAASSGGRAESAETQGLRASGNTEDSPLRTEQRALASEQGAAASSAAVSDTAAAATANRWASGPPSSGGRGFTGHTRPEAGNAEVDDAVGFPQQQQQQQQHADATPAGTSEGAGYPPHIRDALKAVEGQPLAVRAAVLEALLIAECARPRTPAPAQDSQGPSTTTPPPSQSSKPRDKLHRPIQGLVDKAVDDSMSARKLLANAKRLKEGWTDIVTKSSELYEADRVLKFVLPAEQDDIKPVRVPRPLSNLMKGEGCGFKLTGDEVHLTSDRGKELQGLIDDEFRKAALASLKHVLDFKIFEVEQHTATLDSMATKLRHSVDALFTGTEIAADVRTARTDAALKAFEVNAAEKLETAEVSRRNAEISKEKEAKRMNDAELEAREIRNGQTFAANVSQKTTEIVTLNRAESEKLLLETIAAVQAGDAREARVIFDEKNKAARDAAQAAAANESDKDKLKRLRAEQKASADALAAFEKERQGNGNRRQKSVPTGSKDKPQKVKKGKGKGQGKARSGDKN